MKLVASRKVLILSMLQGVSGGPIMTFKGKQNDGDNVRRGSLTVIL